MKKLDQFTRLEVLAILKALNITIKNENREWVSIKSPLRDEKNPSFTINLENGYWEDKGGAKESGFLPELVKRIMPQKSDNNRLKEWFDEVLYRKPKTNLTISKVNDQSSKPFDDVPQVSLKEIGEKNSFDLSKYDDVEDWAFHAIIKQTETYDGIELETLKSFGCKVTTDFAGHELLIPYPTGVQRYSRTHTGKIIRSLNGSKTNESFAGIQFVTGKEKLLITKSPRETMLAFQEFGDEYDVIGLCGSESDTLSMDQLAILNTLKDHVESITTILDCDTNDAKKIAIGLAQNIKSFVQDNCVVGYLNISKLTDSKYKDLADLSRSEQLEKEILQQSILLEKAQPKKPEIKPFWNKNGKISPSILLRQIEEKGLFKWYLGDEAVIYFAHKYIIRKVDINLFADILREHFESIPEDQLDDDLRNSVFDSLLGLRTNKMLENTKPREDLDLHLDDLNTSYIYYQDCYLKITITTVDKLSYEGLKKYIWADEVLKRNSPDTSSNSVGEFELFVESVTGKDPDRKTSAMSCIGYMLHRYKDPSNAKAVICTDEEIGFTNEQNGRTGKTLFTQSQKNIRPTLSIDGMKMDTQSRFIFDRYQEKHRIVSMDEMGKKFEFRDMFSMITGDFTVERKHMNAFMIPFARAPKFIISTNDPIPGSGGSFRGRICVLEFAPHYSDKYSPADEFGHRLFDDWDQKEWEKYDSFIIRCIQTYLTYGLVEKMITYEKRSLIQQTSMSFVDWAEDNLELDVEYDAFKLFRGERGLGLGVDEGALWPVNSRKDSFPSFRSTDAQHLNEKQQTTFNKYLERFATYKGWYFYKKKSNSRVVIIFKLSEDEEKE